ncbi:MAG: response regulator [Verrucomicrobiae bacterium]
MGKLSNQSVLIVDDDPGMLRALEKVLSRDGFQVTRATWVREGIQELMDHDKPFDLILTDLRMPMASGLMVLNAARFAYPDVPVIIITAYGDPSLTPEWWREQGAAAYLEKPIEAARLLETVRRVMEK